MFFIGAIFALMLGPGAQAQEMPGEGVTLNPAIPTWDSARPTDAVYRTLLERLGYTVPASRSLSNPIFYQSVMQGDIDYWTDGYFPIHNAQLPDGFEEEANKAVGTVVKGGAVQGYLVDKASVEKYDITSLEDFKRDEVRASL